MGEVRRIVRQASRRLFVMDLLDVLAVIITAALVGVLLARTTQQVFGLTLPWRPIAWGTAGGVALIGLAVAFVRRRRDLAVARELDARAGLRETLSTALHYERDADPWAQAVRESAARAAVSVRVGAVVPIEPPARWALPACTALAVALLWFVMPRWDVLGKGATRAAKQDQAQQLIQVKQELAADRQKLQEALAKAKVDFVDQPGSDAAAAEMQKPEANDPDALKRAEVRTLTDVADKLQSMKEGDKSQQLDALKQAMRQLKQPGDGPLNEFSRSLARGDFNKASQAMQELQSKLASDAFSPEDKAKLNDQLKSLGKQLQDLAKNQQQVARELQKAGLDQKTAQNLAQKAASNPEGLKDALNQLPNLSDAQKQGLLDVAKSAAKAGEQSGAMGESMSKMAQGMAQQGMQQDGAQASQDLNQSLSDAETLQEDMDNVNAALDQAKQNLAKLGQSLGGQGNQPGNQPGDGQQDGQNPGQSGWKPGASDKFGQGSGGPGRGTGMRPEGAPADFALERKKADVKNTGGPIIGSRLVYGQQVRGESKAQFEDAVSAGATGAAEAMETMQVPRELHDAVKHYFGTLEAKTKAGGGGGGGAGGGAAAKPDEAKPSDKKPADKKPDGKP